MRGNLCSVELHGNPENRTVTAPERLNLICSIHRIRDSLGKQSWRVGGPSRYGGVGDRGNNVPGISKSHSVITLNADGFNPLIRRHSLDDWEKKVPTRSKCRLSSRNMPHCLTVKDTYGTIVKGQKSVFISKLKLKIAGIDFKYLIK